MIGENRAGFQRQSLALFFNIPYGQIIDPAAVPSRCLSMVVAQETTQSLATPHRPFALSSLRRRKQ
jgi:hypothetical protein